MFNAEKKEEMYQTTKLLEKSTGDSVDLDDVDASHRQHDVTPFRGFRNEVIWPWIDEMVDKKVFRDRITIWYSSFGQRRNHEMKRPDWSNTPEPNRAEPNFK